MNLKQHLYKLKNDAQIQNLFVSDLEKLNRQLNDDISAHHPYRGVDKAKYIIQINNNPNHEYEYVNSNWYTSPNREKHFESISELAKHIEENI